MLFEERLPFCGVGRLEGCCYRQVRTTLWHALVIALFTAIDTVSGACADNVTCAACADVRWRGAIQLSLLLLATPRCCICCKLRVHGEPKDGKGY